LNRCCTNIAGGRRRCVLYPDGTPTGNEHLDLLQFTILVNDFLKLLQYLLGLVQITLHQGIDLLDTVMYFFRAYRFQAKEVLVDFIHLLAIRGHSLRDGDCIHVDGETVHLSRFSLAI